MDDRNITFENSLIKRMRDGHQKETKYVVKNVLRMCLVFYAKIRKSPGSKDLETGIEDRI